ncbi:MAG: hypothetical protein K8I60_05425, partial [Anaerolineae bacterium]|nr:hypothetical protein [Anaerolineae bacterium]
MSAAPGLDTLFELSAIFDRGSRAAPDDFLAQILPEIAARIPHNRFARLYSLGNEFALLLAATDSDLPRDFQAALADFPSYVQAIEEKRPIHDATYDFCAVPLVAEDIALG